MKTGNILIVEDHALTRFALKAALKNEKLPGEIFEAPNADCAFEILKEKPVALVIMDLGLPGTDGVKASREIKKQFPEIKIIVLTSHNERQEVLECMECGVNAYCSKDIKPEKLISLINDVLNGAIWYDPFVSDVVLDAAKKINSAPKQKSEKNYNLTCRELKVLNLIKSGDSNLEIAKKLNISINTTKVHVCSILQKLGVDDRTQAAIKAINDNITG